MAQKLNLTRDQLASFLQDFEQIRQFERLFAIVDEVQEASDTTSISIEAGIANATANDALSQLVALSQSTAISCALAENRANQALELIDNLSKAIQGLQLQPPPREFKRSRYGSFYDTTTQLATTIDTATAITFNNTDLSNGVFLGSPTSRVVVDTPGIYNFDTSIQVHKTTGGVGLFYIWFRVNGVDVPDSASQIRIQGNDAEIFSSLNYFFNLKANDYVEIMFSVDDLGVELLAEAAASPHPGVPSIILTVANNIEGVTS